MVEDDVETPASIAIVNVVFRAELPLLVLQARSIARHFDPDVLSEIVVIINDPDEDRCHREIEAMRSEYGCFTNHLQIVNPSALLSEPKRLGDRLHALWVGGGRTRLKAMFRHRRRHGNRSGNPKGWAGNNGWSMQQAFKLLCARVCTSTHIVFLDAKNHFLLPAHAEYFIAADGRARTRSLLPDDKQQTWIEASFKAVGLPAPSSKSAPPTVTPFVIERHLLMDCCRELEEQLGPLENFFATRRGQATEFMLMYAMLDKGEGRWWELHAGGLPASLTIFRPSDPQHPDYTEILEAVKSLRHQPTLIAGIHRTWMVQLQYEPRKALLDFWIDQRLILDKEEFDQLFP